MGKPLMIHLEDDIKIEELKGKMGAKTKIEVVRAGLKLLEKATEKQIRIERWKKIVSLVSKQSILTNKEFQKYSRLKQT